MSDQAPLDTFGMARQREPCLKFDGKFACWKEEHAGGEEEEGWEAEEEIEKDEEKQRSTRQRAENWIRGTEEEKQNRKKKKGEWIYEHILGPQ